MNNKETEKYVGYPQMTIVEAMRKIDITGSGILFIVGEYGQLMGTLTDGDIRRWLIKTGDLNITVSDIMQNNPFFLSDVDRAHALEKMIEKRLRALPIVNEQRQITDIIFNTYNVNEGICGISQALRNVPVVIMAGGKGTRLLPYTHVLPKPLIPIGDKPILEMIIDQFCKYGCEKFFLILNYKKNMIKAYFNELEHDYQIEYIEEKEPLGTGGGLSLLKDKLRGTFILSNCDILIRDDFSSMLDFHKNSGNKISMICSLKNFKIPYGIVHMGPHGAVESMEEKPTVSFFTNTGVYFIESEILEEIPNDTFMGFPEIIDRHRKHGKQVGVYPISESAWLDMGQAEELEKMKKNFEGI